MNKRVLFINKNKVINIVIILSFILFAGCDLGLGEEEKDTVKPKGPIAALFYLGGTLPEFSGESNPFSGQEMSQFTLKKRIEKASTDLLVQEIVIHMGAIGTGWARASEIEDILKNAAKKKPLTCIIESADNKTYAVAASSCPKISIAPAGSVDIIGLGMESLYLKDLLDMIGVKADMLHVGKYKSAAENVTLNEMSDEAREASNSLLSDINSRFISLIASSRKLQKDKIAAIIDNAPYTANQAKKAGLIDNVESIGAVLSRLNKKYKGGVVSNYGKSEPQKFDFTSIVKMFSGDKEDKQKDNASKIAIIPVLGTINSGPAANNFLGGESSVHDLELINILLQAANDDSVKGVVLRIDSPGGSALASDNIWEAVRELKKRKPVVTSMGDVAASGGYYIACATDYIFANPDTITGSIGVVGGKIVIGEALEKLGAHKDGVMLSKRSAIMSPFTPFSEDEKKTVYLSMERMYKLFVNRVSEGRNLKEADILKIAEGRVWTGSQALEIGLVDKMGTLEDAISKAKVLSKTKGVKAVLYPKPKSFMETLGEQLSGQDVTLKYINSFKAGRAALSFGLLLSRNKVLAFSPYLYEIE
ncbi:MAG: signal peptide peptidase SppA, partial [Deltaproteobacteria bacterium]|nr:signal peptide peptidase SppA [Deltaproteobacteria bacterium]